MSHTRTRFLCTAAVIAALYVLLTLLSSGLSGGVVQFRLSEALCVLPLFTPAAIPGLSVGCFLANLLTGAAPWDCLLGPLATLLGALGCFALRHQNPLWAPWPNFAANVAIVPPMLVLLVGIDEAWLPVCLGVALGELVCGAALSYPVRRLCERFRARLFGPTL